MPEKTKTLKLRLILSALISSIAATFFFAPPDFLMIGIQTVIAGSAALLLAMMIFIGIRRFVWFQKSGLMIVIGALTGIVAAWVGDFVFS